MISTMLCVSVLTNVPLKISPLSIRVRKLSTVIYLSALGYIDGAKVLRTQGLVNKSLIDVPGCQRLLNPVILSMALFSCSDGQRFSEFPGFIEHFNKYPPSDTVPNASEIALLKKYKPRVFAAVGQPGPIDFYKDYIADGQLFVGKQKIDAPVTQELLNQHRANPRALFKYHGDYRQKGSSLVYARIDYENTRYEDKQYDFTFLTYNLVFPVSGILQGLGKIQSAGLAIAGNLDDWHQLDHYVNVSVALVNEQAVAMTLQQHNYQTTYLLDSQAPDISVDIAMRSNELYPHHEQQMQHPAVSFLSTKNIEFIVSGAKKPMMAGFDITHGEQEVSYMLEFLPQTDAFYQFKGSLGKNRLLPGRSGPPGADYATLPGLMPRHIRLVTGYRTGSVQQETDLLAQLFDRDKFAIRPNAIDAYKKRFFEKLSK